MFTMWNVLAFVIFGIVFIIAGLGIGFAIGDYNGYTSAGVTIGGVIGVIATIVMIATVGWYNTNTASGARALKDYKSEINNGIEREITITAEDGRLIFFYEGKVDIESNHEDNYIKFESEDGKRYIIYYGIQDTITIIEK